MAKLVIAGTSIVVALALSALVVARRHDDARVTRAPHPRSPATGATAAADPAAAPADEAGFVGVVMAREAVDVAPRAEGRVDTVEARLGDRVARGATVATLDRRATRQDHAMAEAAYRGAQADRDRAATEQSEAQDRLERLTKLDRYLSAEDVSRARYAAKIAAARHETASAQVAEKLARLRQLETALADAQIRAPFDAVVAARWVDPGAVVGPGKPILRLISSDGLRVRFAVPEERAGLLEARTPVRVRILSHDLVVSGLIENVAPEVDNASRMLAAEARLEAPDRPIPSGLEARVWLVRDVGRKRRRQRARARRDS